MDPKYFKITLRKAGKGEPFHFKALIQVHKESMSEVRYLEQGCVYLSTNYFVPSTFDIFWLWFLITIKIKKEKLSEMKMVSYNDTHYAMIDEQLNK